VGVYLRVAREPQQVQLLDPNDCTRLFVAISPEADYSAIMEIPGCCRAEDFDHVLIHIDLLRKLASGRVAADWEERFSAMLSYADRHDWLQAEFVRAHIRWMGDELLLCLNLLWASIGN
jgi:hypothetical protein